MADIDHQGPAWGALFLELTKDMSKVELVRFRSPDELAAGVADSWLRELETTVGKAGHHYVALAGGRIAGRFFAAVTQKAKAQRSSRLTEVQFFWGDERCVPPTEAESNFHMAQQLLLEPLRIPDNQIHRIRGEDPPETAAAQAQTQTRQIVPLGPDDQPAFDLVFLGMGEDGHVASLFPGESEALITSKAVYRAVTASKPPPQRVTMGYATIAAAAQVWVLVSGGGKENALTASLRDGAKTPLGRVLEMRAHTRILTDLPLAETP
jgi:6-phosphogluconolactonase